MAAASRTHPERGWLQLACEDNGFERKWVVLDNGVLWIYRDSGCASTAEQVVPLHDAELQSTTTSTEDVLQVHLGASRDRVRRLRLRPDSAEEYRRWTAAMTEAAQLWHARRQMALMAVLDRGRRRSVARPPAVLDDARMQVVRGLSSLTDQVAELRARTRRAVTRAQGHDDEDAPADALPRFLRRAIADAVEKIWRASRRAHGRAEAHADACRGEDRENVDPLDVYDGVLLLRDAADAFVTYCSLLRDLQIMLQSNGGLALGPLRSLASLRESLAALIALIRTPEEEERQRAALAALDATLQRCWTELSKRPLELDLDIDVVSAPQGTPQTTPPGTPHGTPQATPQATPHGTPHATRQGTPVSCPPRKITESQASSRKVPGSSAEGGEPDRSPTQPPTPCVILKRHLSIRRLTSRLHRDVVRTSVRRARKRARVEGLSLLPDQKLDDSLEDALEMTDLSLSSTSSRAASTAASDDEDESPTTPAAPKPPPRMACSTGGALPPFVVQRRCWRDPALLRRRRLVCSTAECVSRVGDEDQGDEGSDGEGDTHSLDEHVFDDDAPKEVEADAATAWPSARRGADLLSDNPVTPPTPNGGGRRALWCETQEVQRSGLLTRLDTNESALQEAKFEVLSSEESYLRALDVLAHRVQVLEALQAADRDALTNFLDKARACSMRLVGALRALWARDVMMRGLCSLVHTETMPSATLQQYVLIVSLQPRAASVLAGLGTPEAAQLLPLLCLPAQRASRLPLLVAAILRRLDQRTSEAVICRAALDRLNQIVFECNEALRKAEQNERMTELGKMIQREKSSSKKSTWSERKSSVIGKAKSFFLKSNNRLSKKADKVLSSTSSILQLT